MGCEGVVVEWGGSGVGWGVKGWWWSGVGCEGVVLEWGGVGCEGVVVEWGTSGVGWVWVGRHNKIMHCSLFFPKHNQLC